MELSLFTETSLLAVSCANSELEVLPITLNPGIQRLQLQRNNIRAVDAALGFYAQLQYLDMSNNQLISLPDRNGWLLCTIAVMTEKAKKTLLIINHDRAKSFINIIIVDYHLMVFRKGSATKNQSA